MEKLSQEEHEAVLKCIQGVSDAFLKKVEELAAKAKTRDELKKLEKVSNNFFNDFNGAIWGRKK